MQLMRNETNVFDLQRTLTQVQDSMADPSKQTSTDSQREVENSVQLKSLDSQVEFLHKKNKELFKQIRSSEKKVLSSESRMDEM
jgi:predicted transcriptional regulator